MIETSLKVLLTPGPAGYALLDSGNGRKLERFGAIMLDRPEPQAIWKPSLDPGAAWAAHAVFSASGTDEEKGRWRLDRPVSEIWPLPLTVKGLKSAPQALLKLRGFWHVGLFPEQLPHWEWMVERLQHPNGDGPPRVLNLFGYTGAASLIAAAAGAEVVHVDASKTSIQWGRESQAASGLGAAPIRWILDDARKFAAREVRRGRTYDVVLVDPPKFGRGPEGEIWDLFRDIDALMGDVQELVDPRKGALALTVYAIRASVLAFSRVVGDHFSERDGLLEAGELALLTKDSGRLLPTSLFVRWSAS